MHSEGVRTCVRMGSTVGSAEVPTAKDTAALPCVSLPHVSGDTAKWLIIPFLSSSCILFEECQSISEVPIVGGVG